MHEAGTMTTLTVNNDRLRCDIGGRGTTDYHGYRDHGNTRQRTPVPKTSLCFRRRQKLPKYAAIVCGAAVVLIFRILYSDISHQSIKQNADRDLDLNSHNVLDFKHINNGGLNQHSSFHSRHLLSVSKNCTPPAISQFPRPLFTAEQRAKGAVILHILFAAYMFIALAIACDDYFVPACEKLCSLLHMSDDVAGATFMAAGSSAPELATACIGVFIAKDDIGLGAVVGSAVFNIMFVISVCALFAGMVVYLKWWPLVRDCIYYTISIVALVFVIYDEYVHWYEALVLLILYVLYIVLMYFNPILESKFTPCGDRLLVRYKDQEAEPIPLKSTDGNIPNSKTFSDDEKTDSEEEITIHHALLPSGEYKNGTVHSAVDCEAKESPFLQPAHDGDDDEVPPWVLAFPDICWKRVLWVISLPLILLMFISVPDCRQPRWRRWYLVTFLMSIVWIALFSYIMVWMITVTGYTFHIPDTVMGLTFIAAGSSVPDAIASLIVVREGLGDMAVSNAVGSNVFDILLCLGMPWFLQTTIVTPNTPIQVFSEGLTYSALTLLSTVVFLLVATHLNRWRLTKGYGIILMVVYFIFNILASLYELNIFGYVRAPTCPSNY